MKQQNPRMIAEVNKLIGNTIVKDGGIYLPKIGSLSVMTTPPSMSGVAGNGSAPTRKVEFTQEEQHRSIIQIISERGNCTIEQATLIFDKWIESVSALDGKLQIEDVGDIQDGTFTPSFRLTEKLNPTSTEPKSVTQPAEETSEVVEEVTIESESKQESEEPIEQPTVESTPKVNTPNKSNRTSIVVVAAVIIIAIIAAVIYGQCSKEQAEQLPAPPPPAIEIADVTQTTATESIVETTQQQQQRPEPVAKPAATPRELFAQGIKAGVANEHLRYKVIYGAYTVPENCVKAIAQAERKLGRDLNCTIYPHGKTFIVSLHDAATKREASAFIKSCKGSLKDPLWINIR